MRSALRPPYRSQPRQASRRERYRPRRWASHARSTRFITSVFVSRGGSAQAAGAFHANVQRSRHPNAGRNEHPNTWTMERPRGRGVPERRAPVAVGARLTYPRVGTTVRVGTANLCLSSKFGSKYVTMYFYWRPPRAPPLPFCTPSNFVGRARQGELCRSDTPAKLGRALAPRAVP